VRAVESAELYSLRLSKGRTLLAYHWITSGVLADFLIVHSGGLDLYKLQELPLRLLPVKTFAFPTGRFWLEPRTGVLVLAHSSKPGVLRSYFCIQTKVGPKFHLTQPVPASSWAPSFPHVPTLAPPSDHRGVLAQLYEVVHFLHLCQSTGQIKLYLLQLDAAVLLPDPIQRSPGLYDLYVVDSLIVIQSEVRQEEYVYDLSAGRQPFVTVRYGTENQSTKGCLCRREPLLSRLVRVDQDILIDTEAGRCYRLDMRPEELARAQGSLTAVLLFLLRRTGCRLEAFAYLRDQILARAPLKSLSEFFMTSSKAYRQVALRVTPRKFSQSSEPRASLSVEPELKADSGLAVMLQADMLALVLQDLCESPLPSAYVTAVMLEYQRSLVTQEIHVSQGVQQLVARQLVLTGNFVLLQTMLHHRILADCSELVCLLLSAVATYPASLQLALDMLQRLKGHGQAAMLLVERQLLYEACACTDSWSSETLQTVEASLASLPPSELVTMARDFLRGRTTLLPSRSLSK